MDDDWEEKQSLQGMWTTFDNDPPTACEEDIHEAIWSNSYRHYLNYCKSRPNATFVPTQLVDIEMIRKELENLKRVHAHVNDTTSSIVLVHEINKIKQELFEVCPHLIFEAEYLDENSRYDCQTCGLSFLDIQVFHTSSL